MTARFDQGSLLPAAALILGLVGGALFWLGGRLMRAGDEALADFGDEGES